MRALFYRSIFPLAVILLLGACGKLHKKKAAGAKAEEKNSYHFGQVVRFGRGGDADKYKRGGWGENEDGMTWTNARTAHLALQIPDTSKPLKLRMNLAGFTSPPTLPFQPVEVRINDELAAEWQVFSERADYVAIISPEAANHQTLYIDLRIPQANSPRAFSIGDDPRLLGVSAFEFEINEADVAQAVAAVKEAKDRQKESVGNAYLYGTVVNLGEGPAGERYKVVGWYPAEKDFTWTGSGPAVLEMRIQPTQRPLMLKMRLAGMITPGDRPFQPTTVYANGEEIATWDVGLPEDFSARVPKEIAFIGGKLRIELVIPHAAAPKQLNVGDDTRVLGVRCEAFLVTEALSDQDALPTPSPTEHRLRQRP